MAEASGPRRRRYRFGPLQRREVVGPLTLGQVIVLAAAAAIGVLSLYVFRNAVGLLVGVLALTLAALAVFVPIEGRTAEEWAPILWRWRLRGAPGYRSAAVAAGVSVDRRGELAYAPSLPAELGDLDMLEVPYGPAEVGVIRDRGAGTYTTLIGVRAGPFGLRDPAEQERKLDAWGAVLAGCGRDATPIRRLQWIERTLPSHGDQLAGHLHAERDPGVPLDSKLVRSYIELLESAAPQTQEHDILLALQIDQRRGARELRRRGGGDEGACELLMREAESLGERLAIAELEIYGLLRPRQYAELIRDAFDPFGRQGRARAALGDARREGVDPRLMGPLADETAWGHYRSDSALHASYWIGAWPRSDVGPAFMAPLLMQSGVVRSVGVTIEPIPYSTAMRKAEAASTGEIADQIERERQGFMTTARTRRRQQAATRREEELADGHAELRFAGFITVSARSPQELDRSCSEVEHAAQLARLELQRLYGEQDAGFTFTLPLCRGLA